MVGGTNKGYNKDMDKGYNKDMDIGVVREWMRNENRGVDIYKNNYHLKC